MRVMHFDAHATIERVEAGEHILHELYVIVPRELPRKLRITRTKERQASASRGCDLGEAGAILVQSFDELFHGS